MAAGMEWNIKPAIFTVEECFLVFLLKISGHLLTPEENHQVNINHLNQNNENCK